MDRHLNPRYRPRVLVVDANAHAGNRIADIRYASENFHDVFFRNTVTRAEHTRPLHAPTGLNVRREDARSHFLPHTLHLTIPGEPRIGRRSGVLGEVVRVTSNRSRVSVRVRQRSG